MHAYQRWTVALGAITLLALPNPASSQSPVALEERARGAERILVARVADASPRHQRNEFGDDLIITFARLEVEETLKGRAESVVVAVEGGTVDGITMRAASLPTITPGERAVFFLTPGKDGEFRPHLRGQGILKLDANDRVPNSSLTLSEIRRAARAAQQERQ